MMYHRGLREQRGRGLGSILFGLMRGLAPVAKLGLKAGKSFLQDPTVQKFGRQALGIASETAKNLAADLLEGTSSNERAKAELQNARKKLATTLRGGRKRKKQAPMRIYNHKKARKYSLLQ